MSTALLKIYLQLVCCSHYIFLTFIGLQYIIFPGFCSIFESTVHQRKGGIHAIYRSVMETFGWYRLTGFLH